MTEVGVPFVTVYSGGWDHHTNIFPSLKDKALPPVDQGLSALIEDLHERGSLDNTLVICLGEFGRTPKINDRGGRDHWSFAMSVLMAGAGIPGGQIVGATDVKGYYANDNVYSPKTSQPVCTPRWASTLTRFCTRRLDALYSSSITGV